MEGRQDKTHTQRESVCVCVRERERMRHTLRRKSSKVVLLRGLVKDPGGVALAQGLGPVVRRQTVVVGVVLGLLPDVPVALRVVPRGARLDEPGVLVRGVVDDGNTCICDGAVTERTRRIRRGIFQRNKLVMSRGVSEGSHVAIRREGGRLL